MSASQLEKLGYYDEDDLAVAWNHWKTYSAYPKRVAFKDGKLVSFSAGKDTNLVEWWDRDDKSHSDCEIPYCNVSDDFSFLMKHGKYQIVNNPNAPAEALAKLAEDSNESIREFAAKNPSTPAEALEKLAEDKYRLARRSVAKNPSTPAVVLAKLAKDEDYDVRRNVAENLKTPVEVLANLVDDEVAYVRYGVAGNPNTPNEALKKLTDDEDFFVRSRFLKFYKGSNKA